MAQIVNTNVMSLNSQRNLNQSQGALATSLQRLSSGLRINSAKDDAAGLAITERMTSQIRGMNQAARNTNDGISLIQTAEGALTEVGNMLQRVRELSVQAANGTNSASDRVKLQDEVSQLVSEIDRISNATTFNSIDLLDGSFSGTNFQVGINSGDTINLSIAGARSTDLANNTMNTATLNGTMTQAASGVTIAAAVTAGGVAAQDLTISGSEGTTGTAVVIGADDSALTIAANINAKITETGVTATATNSVVMNAFSGVGQYQFTLQGDANSAIDVTISDVSDLSVLRDAINDVSGTTGISATSVGGSLTLTNTTGEDIGIDTLLSTGNSVQVIGNGETTGVTLTSGAADSAVIGGAVELSSDKGFSISSDTAGSTFVDSALADTAQASSESDLASVNISTSAGASSALAVIDAAIASISSSRAELGAMQSRFESTIVNLQTGSENLSAARSRIRDADFAVETAELTRTQILQQAGTAMLAQANAIPQNVLSLLG